jgi:hypothetical protein
MGRGVRNLHDAGADTAPPPADKYCPGYRMISVRRGGKINASALKAMFPQIIANNRAGGWRKLKGAR